MEAPPPYRPKKSNTGLIVGLIIGGVLLCCLLPIGLLGGGTWWAMKNVFPMAKCAMSAEAMQKAIVAYANDNGGKLPNAATWQDQVRPYYEKEVSTPKMKENPFGVVKPNEQWGCEANDGVMTTITFNTALSGKKLDDIKDQSETILLFETKTPGMNVSAKFDAKALGDPPKRFPMAFWLLVPVSGDAKLVDKNGERIKDKNIQASWKVN